MIACDQLLFIHLHKSGGTFVNQLLLQCVPSARQLGYHLPYREAPEEYRRLPVVGTVRNPWDYYVSWFHFQSAQTRPNPLFRICSDDGELGFSDTVRNLAELGSDTSRLRALQALLPDRFLGAGLNLTKACLDELDGRDLGFYSFLYNRMYSGATDLRIVPMEELRSGIRTLLEELQVLPNARAEMFLQQAPRLNVTRHEPYRSYFDAELRDLVAHRESFVITRHGYSF